MSQTVADVLVSALEQTGVKQIFGLIGDSLNPLAQHEVDDLAQGIHVSRRRHFEAPPSSSSGAVNARDPTGS
jgi:thiamine pyrophosphate-dependent acetolactate synthase large subunit-like protein